VVRFWVLTTFLALFDLIFFFSSSLFLAFSIFASIASSFCFSLSWSSFLLFSRLVCRLCYYLRLLLGLPSPGLTCSGNLRKPRGFSESRSLLDGPLICCSRCMLLFAELRGTRSEDFLLSPDRELFLVIGALPFFGSLLLFSCSLSSACSRNSSLTMSDSSFICWSFTIWLRGGDSAGMRSFRSPGGSLEDG